MVSTNGTYNVSMTICDTDIVSTERYILHI